jgi:hypothetical protein
LLIPVTFVFLCIPNEFKPFIDRFPFSAVTHQCVLLPAVTPHGCGETSDVAGGTAYLMHMVEGGQFMQNNYGMTASKAGLNHFWG